MFCPKKDPDCTLITQEIKIDFAPIIGGTTPCLVDFTYTSRKCPNSSFDFEIVGGIDETIWIDAACATRWLAYKKTLNTQNAIDKFWVRTDILIQQQAMLDAAKRFGNGLTNIDDFLCPGKKSITGRYFSGPCAFSCAKFVPVGEVKMKLERFRLFCGSNCCFATQSFCINSDSKVGDVNITPNSDTQYSPNEEYCDINLKIPSTCYDKGTPFLKPSRCISACDLYPTLLAQSGNSDLFDNDGIEISQKTLSEEIEVTLENNALTGQLSIGFVNTFEGKVLLYDTGGKLLFSQFNDANNHSIVIDISKYSSGIYVLTFQSEGKASLSEKVYIR